MRLFADLKEAMHSTTFSGPGRPPTVPESVTNRWAQPTFILGSPDPAYPMATMQMTQSANKALSGCTHRDNVEEVIVTQSVENRGDCLLSDGQAQPFHAATDVH